MIYGTSTRTPWSKQSRIAAASKRRTRRTWPSTTIRNGARPNLEATTSCSPRNGHGAGFWDRYDCLPEGARDRLTAAAETLRGENRGVGDDGNMYID